MESFKIFTPSPILGYGYDLGEFWHTIEYHRPKAIILDAGSTDPGPYMLGTGKTLCSKQSYTRDLTPILKACFQYDIKVLISSAGGAGTNAQVDFMVNIIREIAEKSNQSFKIATIKFNDDRKLFLDNVIANKTIPCGPGPDLMTEDITKATQIVAQMGAEPFLQVLQDDSIDIIIAGRSYDPAPFAAFCMHHGVGESPSWHVGKIAECGGLCTKPKGRSILATMYRDSFDLTPTNPKDKCTPVSVAAHTLYEKTRPDRLPGPGGVLHLDDATYIQQPDKVSVRVTGSKFIPTKVYQIKLEGVQVIGYRTTYIGGIRDPILIDGIDKFLEIVRSTSKAAFPNLDEPNGPQLIFHIYGKNAVMGSLEPLNTTSHEIGVLGEVVAESQDLADSIASFSRTVLLHGAYDGQLATAGNLASPLTPLEQPLGPVFKFSVYHLMDIDDPKSLFPIEKMTVGRVGSIKLNPRLNSMENSAQKMNKINPTPELESAIHQTPKFKTNNSLWLRDIASVIRSKNSGPFEITLDVLFDTQEDFFRVKDTNMLCKETIKKLYHLKDEEILVIMFYQPALAWKCTFKRPWPQGSIGERDTFGAQQHAPLLSIKLPSIQSHKL